MSFDLDPAFRAWSDLIDRHNESDKVRFSHFDPDEDLADDEVQARRAQESATRSHYGRTSRQRLTYREKRVDQAVWSPHARWPDWWKQEGEPALDGGAP